MTALKKFHRELQHQIQAKEGINEHEDWSTETTQTEKKENKNESVQKAYRTLWDIIKRNSIHIIGVPKEAKKDKGVESVFKEIMTENFPNVEKELNT